ncbi:hypothetical protein [Pyrococcus kukulkanii]|uniref:Uncharacterized protein n=1 Tax=Pyrococcus kukulkanii TaxID=1609559 RepID=A0ABV4T647_9EURY
MMRVEKVLMSTLVLIVLAVAVFPTPTVGGKYLAAAFSGGIPPIEYSRSFVGRTVVYSIGTGFFEGDSSESSITSLTRVIVDNGDYLIVGTSTMFIPLGGTVIPLDTSVSLYIRNRDHTIAMPFIEFLFPGEIVLLPDEQVVYSGMNLFGVNLGMYIRSASTIALDLQLGSFFFGTSTDSTKYCAMFYVGVADLSSLSSLETVLVAGQVVITTGPEGVVLFYTSSGVDVIASFSGSDVFLKNAFVEVPGVGRVFPIVITSGVTLYAPYSRVSTVTAGTVTAWLPVMVTFTSSIDAGLGYMLLEVYNNMGVLGQLILDQLELYLQSAGDTSVPSDVMSSITVSFGQGVSSINLLEYSESSGNNPIIAFLDSFTPVATLEPSVVAGPRVLYSGGELLVIPSGATVTAVQVVYSAWGELLAFGFGDFLSRVYTIYLFPGGVLVDCGGEYVVVAFLGGYYLFDLESGSTITISHPLVGGTITYYWPRGSLIVLGGNSAIVSSIVAFLSNGSGSESLVAGVGGYYSITPPGQVTGALYRGVKLVIYGVEFLLIGYAFYLVVGYIGGRDVRRRLVAVLVAVFLLFSGPALLDYIVGNSAGVGAGGASVSGGFPMVYVGDYRGMILYALQSVGNTGMT